MAVTGADRVGFLDAVVSQQLSDMAPGTVRGALYLDGHGNPLAVFDVVVLDDRILLIAPDGEVAREIVDTLGGRTFLADATFALTELTVTAVRGVDARDAIAGSGLEAEPDRVRHLETTIVIGRAEGIDLLAPPDRADGHLEALARRGVPEVDEERFEAWRIQAGIPAWGREVGPGRLPEELGLLPTHVHLAKGCYPGQEAVARMWMLGRPRRRLAVVDLDPGVGAGWEAGSGRAKAVVTSRATDPGDAAPGLAFVPPDASEGSRIEDESGAGLTVRRIVGAGSTVPGHDPAMTRRRDRA